MFQQTIVYGERPSLRGTSDGRGRSVSGDWDLGILFSETSEGWTLWDWTFYGVVAGLFVGVYILWVV
jgi:hypothetical protein